MKILITTFGTRGDIQPFIALAKGLKAAGHSPAICTSTGFQKDVEAHSIQHLNMDNELLELTQALLGKSLPVRENFAIFGKIKAAMRRALDDEWQAALDFQPDLIIYHPKCFGSYHIAEKLDIPAILSIPLPFYTPTNAFAVPFLASDLGARLNRLTYAIIPLSGAAYAGLVNDFRVKTLGLPKMARFADLLVRSNGNPVPVLYPYSPLVVPVPADYPAHVHVTGYWFLDHESEWQAEPALLEFLDGGEAPIFIGFGSLGGRGKAKRTQIIIEAIAKTGQRAIFGGGWGGLDLDQRADNIYGIQSVPHDWLFPHVSMVVHHGGAGTTAAGLRAGKASIICPFIADQPFWGKRVFELGVGTKPIPQRNLNVDTLAEAIETVLHHATMQESASKLGAKIRAEDGIACAIGIIEGIFQAN